MRHILFLIAFIGLFTLSNAQMINECKTDIYYGNGVWNEYEDAYDSNRKLYDVVKLEIVNGNSKLQAKYANVKLAYNWGQGYMLDVLETYYQLREAGQLEGIGYFTVMSILTAGSPEITLGVIATQQLMEPFTRDWEQGNVNEMFNNYYNESFKLGHRVLLVSHSQGNLFVNRLHDVIIPTEYRNYFANLQVASPASKIKAPKGDYVTLIGDPIINPIPGSMDGNANGSPGHAFVESYLGQIDPYTKIVTKLQQLLPTLDSEISQWQREQERDRDTMSYRITVRHRFDSSVIMNEEVYPFAPTEKLYQVNGEYVKASCGGTEILASWEGQEDSAFYLLEGTGEKIENAHKVLRYGPINMTKVIYVENPPATVKSVGCWLPTVRMTYETYSVSIDNGVIKKELIAQRDMGNQSGPYALINGLDSYYISQKYGCISGLQGCFITEDNLEAYLDLVATNAMPTDLNQAITYKYPGYPVGLQYDYSIRTMILDDGTELYEGYEFIYSEISAEDAKQQSDSFLGITGYYMRSCESTEFDKDFNDIYDTKIYGAYL
jgi:hypothetical protein